MLRVNSSARASKQPMPLLRGWKQEMRMLAPVKEKVFPTRSTTGTAKDSESGWEWGKE